MFSLSLSDSVYCVMCWLWSGRPCIWYLPNAAVTSVDIWPPMNKKWLASQNATVKKRWEREGMRLALKPDIPLVFRRQHALLLLVAASRWQAVPSILSGYCLRCDWLRKVLVVAGLRICVSWIWAVVLTRLSDEREQMQNIMFSSDNYTWLQQQMAAVLCAFQIWISEQDIWLKNCICSLYWIKLDMLPCQLSPGDHIGAS